MSVVVFKYLDEVVGLQEPVEGADEVVLVASVEKRGECSIAHGPYNLLVGELSGQVPDELPSAVGEILGSGNPGVSGTSVEVAEEVG